MSKRTKSIPRNAGNLRSVVRFLTHPIWCYSLPQIFAAIQRDWDRDAATTGRSILGEMLRSSCTLVDLTYTTPDGKEVVIECRLKPNDHDMKPNTPGQGRPPKESAS